MPDLDQLPDATPSLPELTDAAVTRGDILQKKHALREERQQARRAGSAGTLRQTQEGLLEEDRLEELLQTRFIPQHGPGQLISPRAFFVSPLFRVCSKTVERERFVEMTLAAGAEQPVLAYSGPELRQSDGLVFMALLNMARDVPAGKLVSFSPEEACRAIFGRYDGPARKRLREHIQRLQGALLKFRTFSVQLCQRFDYPSAGRWTVALDAHIVELFREAPYVWLDLKRRTALPEGLATWLYAFVESQTRLIPMKLETLRTLCGSEACPKAFANKLRDAMRHLTEHGLLEPGWFIEAGVVHWRKREAAVEGLAAEPS